MERFGAQPRFGVLEDSGCPQDQIYYSLNWADPKPKAMTSLAEGGGGCRRRVTCNRESFLDLRLEFSVSKG